jgi:hypothetical protein
VNTRCPRCFYLISSDIRSAFECTGSCSETPDDIASAYQGVSVEMRPVTEVRTGVGGSPSRPQSVTCSNCDGSAGREVCPACHYHLPKGWRDSATTCIAMAGARASGKSFYIAVAIQELKQFCEKQGLLFSYATPETETNYTDKYQNPLYQERRVIAATMPVRTKSAEGEPLIFTVGTLRGKTHRLVIRDVAGEDLEQQSLHRNTFSFFGHADGVVFMFDPMGVPAISEMLAGIVPRDVRRGAEPQVVLRSLQQLLSEISPSMPSSIGLAVVLGKFDVMQQLRAVDHSEWAEIMTQQGAAFLRDPSFELPYYDDVDGRLLDQEIRSLLEKLRSDSVLASVNNISTNTRFFAASSLGQPSQGDKISSLGISPFRCLDAIKWTLARQGVIALEG